VRAQPPDKTKTWPSPLSELRKVTGGAVEMKNPAGVNVHGDRKSLEKNLGLNAGLTGKPP